MRKHGNANLKVEFGIAGTCVCFRVFFRKQKHLMWKYTNDYFECHQTRFGIGSMILKYIHINENASMQSGENALQHHKKKIKQILFALVWIRRNSPGLLRSLYTNPLKWFTKRKQQNKFVVKR